MVGLGTRFFTAILLLSHPAGAAPRDHSIKLAGYVGVQLQRGPQNHLLLPAKVNGQPATFLLDTGSDISFLQSNRAQAFGVRPLDRQAQNSGRWFPLGAIDDLRAGNLPLGPHDVALYNAAQFRGPLPGQRGRAADGLLGLDILRSYNAVINCHTRQIFLQSDPSRRLDLGATTRSMGFAKIPLDQNRRGLLTVPCTIRGRPGKLVLDTGAFVTALNEQATRSLGLKTSPSKLTARAPDGRVRPVRLAQVDDLRIGRTPVAAQPFAVIDVFGKKKPLRTFTGIRNIEYYPARSNTPGQELFGLLGNELLDHHRAIIDLGSMSLFLK